MPRRRVLLTAEGSARSARSVPATAIRARPCVSPSWPCRDLPLPASRHPKASPGASPKDQDVRFLLKITATPPRSDLRGAGLESLRSIRAEPGLALPALRPRARPLVSLRIRPLASRMGVIIPQPRAHAKIGIK